MQHMVKMKEQNIQRLQLQIQALQEETKKQHQQIRRLEMEKEGYNKEAMDTKHRCIEQVRYLCVSHTMFVTHIHTIHVC